MFVNSYNTSGIIKFDRPILVNFLLIVAFSNGKMKSIFSRSVLASAVYRTQKKGFILTIAWMPGRRCR